MKGLELIFFNFLYYCKMKTCASIRNPVDVDTFEQRSITDQVGSLLYNNDNSVKTNRMKESARSVPYCLVKGDEHYIWSDEPLLQDSVYEKIVTTTKKRYLNYKTEHPGSIETILEKSDRYRSVTGKVILSLTTSPERLLTLHYVLKCFYDAIKEHIDVIYVALPHRFRNQPQNKYTIPNELLQRYPLLTLLGVAYDNGPAAKIIHAVEYERQISDKSDNAIFLSIDDDMDYQADYILRILSERMDRLQYEFVVSPKAHTLTRYESFPIVTHPLDQSRTIKTLAQGYGIIAYKGRHIDPLMIKQLANADPSCRLSDDLTISYQLAKDKIGVYSVDLKTNWIQGLPNFPWYKDPNALQAMDGTERPRYNQCWKSVLKPLTTSILPDQIKSKYRFEPYAFTPYGSSLYKEDNDILRLYHALTSPDPIVRKKEVSEMISTRPELFNPDGTGLKKVNTTALHEAIYRNDMELFMLLINTIGKRYPNIINMYDDIQYGNKPLDVAIKSNNIDMITVLLELGAVGETDYNRRGLLTIFDKMDTIDLVASRSIQIQRLFLNYLPVPFNWSKLDKAIYLGFIELAYELVDSLEATNEDNELIVEWIRATKTPEKDILSIVNIMYQGNTLLHICASYHAMRMISSLFFKGIPITQVNQDGQNILHIVSQKSMLTSIQFVSKVEEIKRNTQYIPYGERLYTKLDHHGKTPGWILFERFRNQPYRDGLLLASIRVNAPLLVSKILQQNLHMKDPIRKTSCIIEIKQQQFSKQEADNLLQMIADFDRDWFNFSLKMIFDRREANYYQQFRKPILLPHVKQLVENQLFGKKQSITHRRRKHDTKKKHSTKKKSINK